MLTAYEKGSGRYRDVPPTRFMVAEDDHNLEIEQQLGRIESPASAAARLIDERTRDLPRGLYRIADARDPDIDLIDAPMRDGGVVEDIRLVVADRQIRMLPDAERRALARFIALMYSRAPKIERAMRVVTEAYVAGIRAAVASYGRAIDINATTFLGEELERARWLALRDANRLADPLHATTWWVLRAGPEEEFVIGDSTVIVTLQLGHDDIWRRLLNDDGYVIVMPLGPGLALIIATALLHGVELDKFVPAVNRHSWKWAEDFVMGRDRAVIESVAADFVASGWSDSAPTSVDAQATFWRGIGFVHRALVENEPPRSLLVPSMARMRADSRLPG